MSVVFNEHPVGMVSILVPGLVVMCDRVLLHERINACSSVDDIMNFPIDEAILGK